MKIVADNTIPFLQTIIDPLGDITYLPAGQFTREAIKEADALIVRSIDKCTREILEGSRVKLITTATIGFDHIDTTYCDEAGIVWKNAPGSNAESVAEYVLSSLMMHALQTGKPIQNQTIGIVGVGHVGSRVQRHCEALGMRVILCDPPRAEKEGDAGFVSLAEIAREADIITFHTPLEKGGAHPSWHLADRAFIESLQRKPTLINSSRGAVCDTSALLWGKKQGKIGALILDCWENEPHISLDLLQQTAIATPHIAGFSADGKANATRMCLEEIARFFRLEMPFLDKVKPEAPAQPVIDLDTFAKNRIENAIFTSFNPLVVDARLREMPDKFEWFRNHYDHPREFHAYSFLHANKEEAALLESLGFRRGVV
ncbi:4-phosphoerythronate dehydrogenase PdxB [Parabacteroides sp. OttesenSCG-928-B22]|nr:4-phosphoerythronate dehydrogenase PdxB [Parabacteroides sp. OttesenSCG-928-B22]